MTIGEKIRGIRILKGLSQENMAGMLDLSIRTYGDIERGLKDISLSRLEEIANKLGVSVQDILSFSDKVNNFFDSCNSVVAGINNGGQTIYNNDTREMQHQIEKAQLEIQKQELEKDKLKAVIEKLELEVKYWCEKYELTTSKSAI